MCVCVDLEASVCREKSGEMGRKSVPPFPTYRMKDEMKRYLIDPSFSVVLS